MLQKLLHTIFFLLLTSAGFSQLSESLLFTHISEENGLSDNNTNCVIKDTRGFVWIGTDDGLNMLDGSTIKVFKHNANDSNSIVNNHINLLLEDSNHNIWMGTGNGVSCYHVKEGKFINYHPSGTSYGGAINIITGIAVNGYTLWIGTDGGLFEMSTSTGKQKLLSAGENQPLITRKACNKISCMIQDKEGIIWLGTYDGLWSYNPSKNKYTKEITAENDSQYDPLIMSIADNGDKLWLGTWGKGLKLFDKKTGTIKTWYNGGSRLISTNIFTKKNGMTCLLLNGQLDCFDNNTQTFKKLVEKSSDAYPDAQEVYVSVDNWIWYCTNNGLYIYNPQRQTFKTQVFEKNITTQIIVLGSTAGKLLMGSGSKSILKTYNDSFHQVDDYYDALLKNPDIPASTEALSLCIEDNNSWWLGTSSGIAHINPISKQAKWFVHNEKDSTSLPRNFINCVFLDHLKKLWIFPWREGVWQMDKLTGKCTRVIDGISSFNRIKKKLVIADAVEDSAGNIWLADMDQGVILYERSTNKFSQPFTSIIGTSPPIVRLYKRNEWMYTVANNLFVKWKDKRTCIAIPFPEEMSKKVYDFAPDKEGDWWFVTKNGLIYFNEKQKNFKRFTTADGLYTNDLMATLFCKQNGEMIIGAPGFLSTFLPEKLLATSPVVPSVIVTNISANGNAIPFNKNEKIELTYTQNNIVVNWALPDYINPFKNQYYCMLQGIDSAWRYVGNRGEVQYANLSPGKYTILLKAADAIGDMAPNITQVSIVIHQPFWKTGWFILGCVLVVGGTVYYFTNKHIKGIKKKAAVEQQMAELEMKALRAQMNPHFIFNSLNSIQECIVMNNRDAAYTYLGKFSKLVRRILENSGKLFVSLNEEIDMLQWYVQLEQLRFKEPVLFSIRVDDNVDANNINLPGMIIQPYVENALWHGLATKEGEKKLHIDFVQKKDCIECIIEDNGVGRSNTKTGQVSSGKTKSMGMMITRERLAIFNKQAKVETHDLLNESGQPAGTKIIIYLPIE